MQRWLNLAAVLLVAVLLLGGAFRPDTATGGGEVGPDPGFLAPDIRGYGPDGTPVRLADLRGKAVFLNFWASWCPPCRLEMPEIDRLAGNPPEGTAVLTVNATDTEPSSEAVAEFLAASGYRFPVVLDPQGKAVRAYRVNALPTSFFIDPRGVITRRFAGPMTYAMMVDELNKALNQAGPVAGGSAGLPALPESLALAGLSLRTDILLLVVGFALAAWLAGRALSKRGLPARAATDVLAALVLGGLLGGKLAAVVADPRPYLARPGLLLASAASPAALVGTLLGAGLWAGRELRRLGRQQGSGGFWSLLDDLAVPLLAGGAVAAAGSLGLAAGAGLLAAATVTAGLRWAAGSATPAPGQTALAAVVLASLGLVVADFFRIAPVIWGGLSGLQLALTAAGLAAAAYAGRLAQTQART